MIAHRTAFLLIVLVGCLCLPGTSPADHLAHRSCYAAIAYSKSTGKYGYSHGFHSYSGAEWEAIRRCGADDAEVVVWSRNNWCALALGDDQESYGYGWGGCAADAKSHALRCCRERTENCYIAVCVYSGH